MKRTFLAFSALAALAAGSVTAATAQEPYMGRPGGVYVHPHQDYDSRGSNCRTVTADSTDNMGNRVTVSRSVCD